MHRVRMSQLRKRLRLSSPMPLTIALLATVMLTLLAPPDTSARAVESAEPIPVLAYYYIWYTPSSWARAKTDYPILGRYDSGEQLVMRQHIRWAKEAGLKGFIVSWKSTTALNGRLEDLIEVAREEDFKLAIIYQGLDFEREPLDIDRISADFDLFIAEFSKSDVFRIFSRPLVIWSGSWEFSPTEIAAVTETRRQDLLILASEKNVQGYERLRGLVDGDAYYWSSVNPATYPGYAEKLQEMASRVHADGGIWIAPAAPGFDARLVGGTRIVPREDGAMLRTQFDSAVLSSPDAIGLISWNEFSENSHLEPSERHGFRSLEVLADILGGQPPAAIDFDSSAPSGSSYRNGVWLVVAAFALVIGSCTVIAWRNRHEEKNPFA